MKIYISAAKSLFIFLVATCEAQASSLHKTTEYYGNWGLEKIGAASAYDLGFTGNKVPIGIGDQGFDLTHPEFQDRSEKPLALFTRSLRAGSPFSLGYLEATTSHPNHGTHVSGIIGAARDGKQMHGVAYKAHLVPALYLPVIGKDYTKPDALPSRRLPINTRTFDELYALAQTDPIGFWQPYADLLSTSLTLPTKNFVTGNNATSYVTLKKKFPTLKAFNESAGFAYTTYENFAHIGDLSMENALQNLAEATLDTLLEEAEGDKDLAIINFSEQAFYAYLNVPFNFSGPDIPSPFLLKLAALHAPRWVTIYATAKKEGYTIIKAAGNESLVEPPPEHLFSYFYPWAYGTQMVVVATNKNNNLASYSNWCGHTKNYCLAAPGGDEEINTELGVLEDDGILSATPDGKYEKKSGTSMAAPHVAGTWALAQEIFPQATNFDLFSLILKTATLHPTDPQHAKGELSDIYGWGHLSVSNIIRAIHPLTAEIYDSTRQATFSSLTPILENLSQLGSTWRRVVDRISPENSRRNSLWAYALKGWEKDKRVFTHGLSSFVYATDSTVSGIMGGYDFVAQEKLRLGLGGAFTETNAHTKSRIGTADVKGAHLLGYVNWVNNAWFIDGTGIASFFHTETQRRAIPGTENTLLSYKNFQATSNNSTYGFGSEVTAGYTWKTRTGMYIEPYALGFLTALNRSSFLEKGADIFNLQGDSAFFLNANLGAGTRLATPWRAIGAGLAAQFEGNIAYLRRIGNTHNAPQVSLLGRSIQPIGVQSTHNKNTLRLGAALTFKPLSPEGKVEISFIYKGDIQNQASLNVMSGNFIYRF